VEQTRSLSKRRCEAGHFRELTPDPIQQQWIDWAWRAVLGGRLNVIDRAREGIRRFRTGSHTSP
jgi:hypothetical protein